ncbi:hypothetical protein FRC01_000867 [Tulasnella sp. 417]|nr:hypothetical protein FRC01_000867 [Tulasnella sp. 417]
MSDGFVATLCTQALLIAVGHQKMLFIFSGIHGVIFLPALFCLYNIPTPERTTSITWIVMDQVRDRRFWFLALSIMFTAFATLPPFVFLTSFTVKTSPGISPMLAVLPLALVNLTAVFGRTIAAFLIRPYAPSPPDHASQEHEWKHGWRIGVEPRLAFAGTILLAALSQLIWAFANSYSQIVVYACINGLFGVTFLSILPTLSAITFTGAKKTAAVGSLIIFGAPGCFFGAYVFNTIMRRTGSWTIGLLVVGAFQVIGAVFAFCV